MIVGKGFGEKRSFVENWEVMLLVVCVVISFFTSADCEKALCCFWRSTKGAVCRKCTKIVVQLLRNSPTRVCVVFSYSRAPKEEDVNTAFLGRFIVDVGRNDKKTIRL